MDLNALLINITIIILVVTFFSSFIFANHMKEPKINTALKRAFLLSLSLSAIWLIPVSISIVFRNPSAHAAQNSSSDVLSPIMGQVIVLFVVYSLFSMLGLTIKTVMKKIKKFTQKEESLDTH